MNEPVVSPIETFERLIGEARDSRRKRSLEAINEVCRLLSERHSSDLSYRAIVTLGSDRGLAVPSEKSLMNPTGEHYRELIQSWRLVSRPQRGFDKFSSNEWIENIEDPVLRMSVALLAKELRSLKSKQARKAVMADSSVHLAVSEGAAAYMVPRLNEIELCALKAAIDPVALGFVGLSIGSRGDVLDMSGRKVFKPGFRDAVEKVLAIHTK